MALAEFLAELDSLARKANETFAAVGDAVGLEAARVEFVGARSGRLKDVQKGLGQVDKADKPAAGKRFNEVKQQIDAALQAATERLAEKKAAKAESCQFDPTVPGMRPRLGTTDGRHRSLDGSLQSCVPRFRPGAGRRRSFAHRREPEWASADTNRYW